MPDRTAHPKPSYRLRKALAAVWTLLILVLCTIPGDDLPDVDVVSADKLGHFVIFAGFGWLWMWASRPNVRSVTLILLCAGLLFAGGTELYQGLLPFERQPSWADAVANVLGLVVGIWLYNFTRSRSDFTEP